MNRPLPLLLVTGIAFGCNFPLGKLAVVYVFVAVFWIVSAGILIAFLAGVLGDFDAALQRWSNANNPFYAGPMADVLALLPFALLMLLLWLVARGSRLAGDTPPKGR